MPHVGKPELLMPISDEGAALQFFVEAMKANTAALEQVGKTMRGMQDEQKETLKLVHDTRERVIRIESGGTAEVIAELRAKVTTLDGEIDRLRSDKDRRDGALSLTNWFFRNWPMLIAMAGFAAVLMKANGKL